MNKFHLTIPLRVTVLLLPLLYAEEGGEGSWGNLAHPGSGRLWQFLF